MRVNPRSIYGFLSASSDSYNIAIPWQTSVQDGAFAMNYDRAKAMEHNLICWANTNWGERVMRFRFGLDARRSLFDPITILKEKLIATTNQQIPIYFPLIVVDSVDVISSDEDNSLSNNAIRYSLRAHFKDDDNDKILVNTILGT